MIVLDIESTGLNPTKSSIISLAALELENPTNYFYEECHPFIGADIDPEALKITGMTKRKLFQIEKLL